MLATMLAGPSIQDQGNANLAALGLNSDDLDNDQEGDHLTATKNRIDDYLAKTYKLGKRKLAINVNYMNMPLEYGYLGQYHGFDNPLMGTPMGPQYGLPGPKYMHGLGSGLSGFNGLGGGYGGGQGGLGGGYGGGLGGYGGHGGYFGQGSQFGGTNDPFGQFGGVAPVMGTSMYGGPNLPYMQSPFVPEAPQPYGQTSPYGFQNPGPSSPYGYQNPGPSSPYGFQNPGQTSPYGFQNQMYGGQSSYGTAPAGGSPAYPSAPS